MHSGEHPDSPSDERGDRSGREGVIVGIPGSSTGSQRRNLRRGRRFGLPDRVGPPGSPPDSSPLDDRPVRVAPGVRLFRDSRCGHMFALPYTFRSAGRLRAGSSGRSALSRSQDAPTRGAGEGTSTRP